MLQLFQAIYDRVLNSADGLAFRNLLDDDPETTKAFYYGRARQDKDIQQYCVYSGFETIDEKVYRAVIDNVPIQFNNYSRSSSAVPCINAHNACKELFENIKLPVTDYYDVIFNKVLEVPPVDIDGIKWMAVLEFNVLLQKREV